METGLCLFVCGLLALAAAVVAYVRRQGRRDSELMALADSLRLCGAVGVARDNGPHRMHDCSLGNLHAALDPMHYCAECGAYWRTPAYVSAEINELEAMLDDPVEPDGRTR